MPTSTVTVRPVYPTHTPNVFANAGFDASQEDPAAEAHDWNFHPPALYKVLDGVANRLKLGPGHTSPHSLRVSTGSRESMGSHASHFESARSSISSADSNFESCVSPGHAHRDVAGAAHTGAPAPLAFDVDAIAWMFDRCLAGLELNLTGLSDDEMACLQALEPQEWCALLEAARAEGGEAIRYVEMDASLLASGLPGLETVSGLECVSVWAPQGGGTLDFGRLQGNHLRINILGTPNLPLDIIACKGVKIEPGFGANAALKASKVFLRDGNTVSHSPLALGLPEPLRAAAPVAASTTPVLGGYGVLRGYLIKALNDLDATPAREPAASDARAVADAILRCGGFDGEGAFGFDFTRLDGRQAALLQALPVGAFTALQEYAAGNGIHTDHQVGTDVHWIRLHERFVINEHLVTRLKEFAPLFRLFVPSPTQANSINLGRLHGGEVLLGEVIVSATRPLGILVAEGVEVYADEGTPPDALAKSEVIHLAANGRVAGRPCPLLQLQPANSPTNV